MRLTARLNFGMLLALAIAAAAAAPAAEPSDKPTPSAHRLGPHGLAGWTLDSPIPNSGYVDQRFSLTLVIARRGHVVRRIPGEPIIWKWIFWADGKQIAYETGAFHFTDNCYLMRLSDGRRLRHYDCYHDLPPAKPDWVKALNAAG